MERKKAFMGWKCTLSPDEVDYAKNKFVLGGVINRWKILPNGEAVLRVAPWLFGSWVLMETFIEGLGEGGYSTVNIIKKGKAEIIEKEF